MKVMSGFSGGQALKLEVWPVESPVHENAQDAGPNLSRHPPASRYFLIGQLKKLLGCDACRNGPGLQDGEVTIRDPKFDILRQRIMFF